MGSTVGHVSATAPPTFVVGTGGAGISVVTRLHRSGFAGVHLVAVDAAETEGLRETPVELKISLAEALPFRRGGRELPFAQQEISSIEDTFGEALPELSSGENLVIIVSALGGIGGFLCHALARWSKLAGNLTIAVVTTPFPFEGQARRLYAERALDLILPVADSVVTIPDEALLDRGVDRRVFDGSLLVPDAFRMLDALLCDVVEAILTPLVDWMEPRMMYRSFRCLPYPWEVWAGPGRTFVGLGYGEGEVAAMKAAKAALACPLLKDAQPGRATSVFAVFESGRDQRTADIWAALKRVSQQIAADARLTHVTLIDPDLGDFAKVILLISRSQSSLKEGEDV